MAPAENCPQLDSAVPTLPECSSVADVACKRPCQNCWSSWLGVDPAHGGSLGSVTQSHAALSSGSSAGPVDDSPFADELRPSDFGLHMESHVTRGPSVSRRGIPYFSSPAIVPDVSRRLIPSSDIAPTSFGFVPGSGADFNVYPGIALHNGGGPTNGPRTISVQQAASLVEQYRRTLQQFVFPSNRYRDSHATVPDLTVNSAPNMLHTPFCFDGLSDSATVVHPAQLPHHDTLDAHSTHACAHALSNAQLHETIDQCGVVIPPVSTHGVASTSGATAAVATSNCTVPATTEPQEHPLDGVHAPPQEAGSSSAVLRKRKRIKFSGIIGEHTLCFECRGRDYAGIRLGRALEADLQVLCGSDYRGFLYGLGQKITWVIAFDARADYTTKQKNCRHARASAEPLYFARERIVREVAKVVQDFLKADAPRFLHRRCL